MVPLKATNLHNEVDRYLAMDVEYVNDSLTWWHEHRATYPRLFHMALDYHSRYVECPCIIWFVCLHYFGSYIY
jgi:hypothetical protein